MELAGGDIVWWWKLHERSVRLCTDGSGAVEKSIELDSAVQVSVESIQVYTELYSLAQHCRGLWLAMALWDSYGFCNLL